MAQVSRMCSVLFGVREPLGIPRTSEGGYFQSMYRGAHHLVRWVITGCHRSHHLRSCRPRRRGPPGGTCIDIPAPLKTRSTPYLLALFTALESPRHSLDMLQAILGVFLKMRADGEIKFLVGGKETLSLRYSDAMMVYPFLGGLSSLVDENKVEEGQQMRKIVTECYSIATPCDGRALVPPGWLCVFVSQDPGFRSLNPSTTPFPRL